MALLDTNVLIDLSQGNTTDEGRRANTFLLQKLRDGDSLHTSRLNEAEFGIGSHRARDPAAERIKIEDVLSTVVVVEFDAAAAHAFAAAKAKLLSLGRFPGDMDVLIAAVCLAHDQPLVTRNPRHFADVPGLTVESY